jgi:DNA polymerase
MLKGDRDIGATFAPDEIGWIDFETKSSGADISAGAYRYAVDADAIICAWAIGDNPVSVTAVDRFDGEPLCWADMPEAIQIHHVRVCRGEGIWAAFNAGFDRAIWNFATLGFPQLDPRHTIDVMAQGVAAGLPPDLAQASNVAGNIYRKDDAGKKLIQKFCLPKSTATPQSHPDEWRAFMNYAAADIDAMRAVFRVTRQLSRAEWAEYWAMEAINDRGVRIDLDMVAHAAKLAGEDKVRSAQELYVLTRGAVRTVDQVARLTQWLLERLPPEGREILTRRDEETGENGEIKRPAKYALTRRRVERLLVYCQAAMQDTHATPYDLAWLNWAERVLQIRRYGGSKTPAKFSKMLEQQIDGHLFGQYVFNGAAQTGRASSRGVQVHNLARDTLPYEHEAIEALLAGCSYNQLALLGDDAPVSRKLSLLIRPAFVPRSGRAFIWSDWSQIEARVLPWLAGDVPGARARLQIFRDVDADPSVPDLYTRTAADVSGMPIDEVTKPVRQRGKVAELALGFGGGLGALQAMGAGYGLYLADDEARQIVNRWRAANAWCVDYWGKLWDAIQLAMDNPGELQTAGRIGYIYLPAYLKGSLLCLLPSGRFITYRDIRLERVPDLDDDDNITGYSTHLRFARGYGRVKFWHGMATENVVQAVAADVLRGTLRRLDEAGYQVRLHTHDEILVETLDGAGKQMAIELGLIMQHGFDWSDGLPLTSEETIAYYYTKQELAA